jgi:hypothetical protein
MGGWVLGVDVRERCVAAAVAAAGRVEPVEFADGWELPAPVLNGAQLGAVVARARTGQLAGVPDQVVLAVPAGWGRPRTDALVGAAAEAGLPTPTLVARPVAAAWHLAADTRQGQFAAVVDTASDGTEVSLLRRTGRGFDLCGEPRAVTIPDGQPPAVGARRGMAELAALMAAEAVSARDLSGLYVTGPASRDPDVAGAIAEGFWAEPRPVSDPSTATARGAAKFALSQGRLPASRPLRRSRRSAASRRSPASRRAVLTGACGLVVVAAAGLVSALLLSHHSGPDGASAGDASTPTATPGTVRSTVPAVAAGVPGAPVDHSASPPLPALRPGAYRVNKVMGIAGSWITTLDTVQVAKNGETTFVIGIGLMGYGGGGGLLDCAESSTPLHASITYGDGNVQDSVDAYCPAHPDKALVTQSQVVALVAYAVFANSRGLGQPFTLNWTGPEGLYATLRNVTVTQK